MDHAQKRGFEIPNHTQTPNSFFDESLKEIGSLMELKVVLAIIRQTFGWQKRKDRISISQLEQITGLPRRSVQRGISQALEHQYIEREPIGQSFLYSLKLATACHPRQYVASDNVSPELATGTALEPATICRPQKKGIKEKEESVPRNGNGKDPALLNPLVVAYREICHITPNAQQRADIIATVTDSVLWDRVLKQFMREGRQPQRVDWTLERYGKAAAQPRTVYTSADLDRMGV